MHYLHLILVGIGFLLGSTTTYLYKENEIKKIYLQISKQTQENQVAANQVFENHYIESKEISKKFEENKKNIENKQLKITESGEYFEEINKMYAKEFI
jgi:hypothetical protein